MDKPGGVFLRDWHSLPDDSRNLLLSAAGIVLNGNRGPLQQQLTAAGEGAALPPFVPVAGIAEEPSAPLPFLELPYFNGLGGFTPDGKEYAIYLRPSKWRSQSPLPAPEHDGSVVFGVELPPGTYQAEWVDPKLGTVEKKEKIKHNGGVRQMEAPNFSGDIALRIKAAVR